MEHPAKRIKLEADIEPTLSALPTVDISANSDCEADLSFEVKAELKPHCSQCNLIFHSDAEHTFHISNWHIHIFVKPATRDSQINKASMP